MGNFNEHWIAFERGRVKISKTVASAFRAMQCVRETAYQMAQHYLAMFKNHRDDLVAEVQQKYGSSGDSLDKFLRDAFKPLLLIGEQPGALFGAINQGVTKRQYLSDPSVVIIHRGKKVKAAFNAATPPNPPARPSSHLSVTEQNSMLKSRCDALEQENSMLRRKCGLLEKENTRLRATVKKLQSVLIKASKQEA